MLLLLLLLLLLYDVLLMELWPFVKGFHFYWILFPSGRLAGLFDSVFFLFFLKLERVIMLTIKLKDTSDSVGCFFIFVVCWPYLNLNEVLNGNFVALMAIHYEKYSKS